MWDRFLTVWPVLPLLGAGLGIYWGANRWIGLKRPFTLVAYYTIALGFEVLALYILYKAGAFGK